LVLPPIPIDPPPPSVDPPEREGKLIEFRKPGPAAPPLAPFTFQQKRRRFPWIPAEEKLCIAVRHVSDGKQVVIVIDDPARPGKPFEVWLDRNQARDFSHALSMAYNQSWQLEDDRRRAVAVRTKLDELVIKGRVRTLTRCDLDKSPWWEIEYSDSGDGKAPAKTRRYETEKKARQDFRYGIGKPACGAPGRAFGCMIACRRRKGHPLPHRCMGVEWSDEQAQRAAQRGGTL
jgi:hypothetical protein